MPKLGPHKLQPKLSSKPFDEENPRRNYAGPKPSVLLILDGWGLGPNYAGNAITNSKTPNLDLLWLSFPHTQLSASGEAVGLPRGEDGNSETGHLNIGAGNIVYQELPRINMSIQDGSFLSNQAFWGAFNHVKENPNAKLHLMGLVGDGNVHASADHLLMLLEMAGRAGLGNRTYIHIFTDGRDSPPMAGKDKIQQILNFCGAKQVGRIASLMGRFYAMDRDLRWDRIEKAYNCLTLGSQLQYAYPITAIEDQYAKGVTDEFIEPCSIIYDNKPVTIDDGDAVIFFNFRIDRPRELTKAFVLEDFDKGVGEAQFDPWAEKYEKTVLKQAPASRTFAREKVVKDLYFVTMTRYEDDLPTEVAFPPHKVAYPLCRVFAEAGLKQLRSTESEKEKFVTYYMNGQKEFIFPGEDRVILPSKGETSYDKVPEMSAREIGYEIIERIKTNDYDVMVINIANGDMVGHTGNLQAGIKACAIVDEVAGEIVKAVYNAGGLTLITADHGNVEEMINMETGEIDTEHSTYPVPLIIVSPEYANQSRTLPNGVLADIAPTMLKLMNLPKPADMTGRSLI